MYLCSFGFALIVIISIQTCIQEKDLLQELIICLSTVKEQIKDESKIIQNTLKDKIESSKNTLKGNINNLISNANRNIETLNCTTSTEVALKQLKLKALDKFMVCVNFTTSAANFQQLGYDLLMFAETLDDLSNQIVTSIEACTDIEETHCVPTTLDSYLSDYSNSEIQILVFQDSVKKLTEGLVTEFSQCLCDSESSISRQISKIVKESCVQNK